MGESLIEEKEYFDERQLAILNEGALEVFCEDGKIDAVKFSKLMSKVCETPERETLLDVLCWLGYEEKKEEK